LKGSLPLTPEEHNKYVGLAQLAYAGIYLIMMLGLTGVQAYMFQNIYSRSLEMGGEPPPPFIAAMFVFIGVFSVIMTIPSLVAGYALLRRRSWAKVAGIVGGVVAATNFPFGTAVAVYTFWFLFGDVGKQIYPAKTKLLPPPPPTEWQTSSGYSGSNDAPVGYNPSSHDR
jgi:hypothetical protein